MFSGVMKKDITQEMLKSLVSNVPVGAKAGTKNNEGYVVFSINDSFHKNHGMVLPC